MHLFWRCAPFFTALEVNNKTEETEETRAAIYCNTYHIIIVIKRYNIDILTMFASSIMIYLSDSLRKMFYLCTPNELALDTNDPFPDYMLQNGIPMFFFLIAIEAIIANFIYPKWKRSDYRINDTIACILIGTFQQIGNVLIDVLAVTLDVTVYEYIYNNFRLFDISAKQYPYFVFICLLLGKDFGYYCYHRFLHEYHIGWSAHRVHHSGEDYNLATALRQGLFQPLFSPPFYCWLAILGFSPQAYSAHAQLNTLYMFWIHTDMIDRLPFGLEYILNTPMAHRLHHRPPGNANYAGKTF